MPGAGEGLHLERTYPISVELADPLDLDLAQRRRSIFEAGTARRVTPAASQAEGQAASEAVKTARKLGITPYLENQEQVRARQRG